MKQALVRLLYNFCKMFMGWTLHMIMCVLLCYPVSIHMSQLLSTGRPISSFICNKTNFKLYPVQCSLSSAISRVCTHSGASCRKMNSPTRLCCRYQAKHSKRTEEICLLSEATTHIFPHRSRNGLEKQFILFYISS